MKAYCILFLMLCNSLLAGAQNAYKDPLMEVYDDVLDMYSSSEMDYKTRISNSAQSFITLIDNIKKNGDYGDTALMIRAYESFLNLLKKTGRMDLLDSWNRKFVKEFDLSTKAGLVMYLHFVSSYKEDNDLDKEKAITTFSYNGEATKGLEFMNDCPLNMESFSAYDQARYLAVKADMQLYCGKYDDALTNYEKALDLTKASKGEKSSEYLLFRQFKEVTLSYQKKYNEALEVALKTKEIMDSFSVTYEALNMVIHGQNYKEYGSLLSRIATYQKLLNNKSEALKFYEEALAASYDNYDSNYLLIEPHQINCLPVNGPSEYLYRSTLYNKQLLADNYYDNSLQDKSRELYKELILDYNEQANSTVNLRKLDLISLKRVMEPVIILSPKCAYRFPNDDILQEYAYNSALLYKNFSLSTDNLLLKLVKEDSSSAKPLYDRIITLKEELDIAPTDQRTMLAEEIRQLNEQLLVEVDFSSYGSVINMDWKQVQEHLSEREIAIEFMLTTGEDGEKLYLANILKSSGQPHSIVLCKEKELLSIVDLYSTPQVHNLIWGPLKEEMKDIQTIYFSPTGLIHKIAIEYVHGEDGKNMNKKYAMYRLSSTREILNSKQIVQSGGINAVYGGIQYEIDTTGELRESDLLDDVQQNTKLRSGVNYLPQTLVELQNVEKILMSSGEVHSFSGKDATEESFKNLSGKKVNILHVATHGFYVPKHRKSSLSNILKNPFNSLEDQSLSRAGLLMAGANNTLEKKPKTGSEDGILTAKEISLLDLSDVNLVVLSACETGLGDLTDEGVFGLQRGLKKAGVNTIMMSLWEVDDEATQILMSTFYKNYCNGLTKRDAFHRAQEFLRSTQDKKFDNPQFWAAFIMLDAFN